MNKTHPDVLYNYTNFIIHSPPDRPDHAFYLTPLVRPKEKCWFKKVPLSHNKLANVVPRLMKSAGIEGYFTNHSLRATATTRLKTESLKTKDC